MNGVSADELVSNNYFKYNDNSVETVDKGQTGYLDFEGYLTLLSAQMANQDFNNSMSDSEFIQQMASYSMMEAISQMNKQSQLTYSASLIGKAVTVTDVNGKPDTGIVEAVTMTDKGCNLLVNGTQYESTKITDVVDGEIYSKLNLFTGHRVELKNDKGEVVTGKVTSVFISNGSGFVVLDNKKEYSLNSITKIIDEDEGSKDDDSEGTEGTEGTEGSEGTENSGGEGTGSESAGGTDTGSGTEAGSAAVESSAAAAASRRVYSDPMGVTSRLGSSGADTLLKMMSGESTGSASDMMSYASAAVRSQLEAMAVRRVASVEDMEAGAGLPSDSDVVRRRVPAPSAYNGAYGNTLDNSGNNASGNETSGYGTGGNVYSSNMLGARSGISGDTGSISSRIPAPSVYNQYAGSVNNADSSNTSRLVRSENSLRNSRSADSTVSQSRAKSTYDTGATYGTLSVKDMDAAAQNMETYVNNNGRMNVPASTRKYADTYAMEAAFADSVGTKMGDIRFIGNTDIMNRVDTSEVIGYSESGRAVTDIGWCGKGRLGEVVTFADGRQRVEVILGDDVSYFYTTGKYSLNEMFSDNVPGGYWYERLTPQERALRHYAKEYNPAEQAEMNAFEQYAVRHANTYIG